MLFRRQALAICVALLSVPAMADTTYTYTGNDFTSADSPYTTADSVTGSFTVASPLGPNFLYQEVDYTSYSFSDGVQTETNAYFAEIYIATDGSGDITHWVVDFVDFVGLTWVSTAYSPVLTNNSDSGSDYILGQLDQGSNDNDPGTWTSQTTDTPPSPTPEPSPIVLLGTGIICVLTVLKRRSRPRPAPIRSEA